VEWPDIDESDPAITDDSSGRQRGGIPAQPDSIPGQGGTIVGANIRRMRKKSGWSIDQLANETLFDKTQILRHEIKGQQPRHKALEIYALAFTKGLKRTVTVEELTSEYDPEKLK
jgi:hypothetical protein